MKKIRIIFIFFLLNSITWAQQLYHFNQPLFNDLILNPAVAGTLPCKVIGLDVRKQWAGFPGSPSTQNVFFHGSFYKKVGLGAIVYNDVAGAVNMRGLELDYAYHAIKNKKHLLSFGLGGTVLQYSIDQSDFKPELANDPTLTTSSPSKITYDMAAGVFYKNNYFLVSAGAKHLIQTKIDVSNTNQTKLIRHYYFNASYNFLLKHNRRFEPSLYVRSIGKPMPQIDLSSKFIFNDVYWIGLSYRMRDAITAFAGVEIGQFAIGYGYEYSVSLLRPYTSGSHEVFLKYELCKKKKTDFTLDPELEKRKRRGYKSVFCPVW